MIGGNIDAIIQIRHNGAKNMIGERTSHWLSVSKVRGWLDYMSGESKYSSFSAKVQESSHLFICDYQEDVKKLYYLLDNKGNYVFDSDNCTIRTKIGADGDKFESVTSENARLLINGKIYDIVLIDNPMELNQHYEIYLKEVGE